MEKTLRYLLVTTVTFLIVSCEKDSGLEPPNYEAKYVLNFALSADCNPNWATVYKTDFYYQNYGAGQITFSQSAQIEIENESGNKTSLVYSPDSNACLKLTNSASLELQYNTKYKTKVTMSDGKVLTGETTIPSSIKETSVNINYTLNIVNETDSLFKFSIDWLDNPNEINYYRIYANKVFVNKNNIADTAVRIAYILPQPLYITDEYAIGNKIQVNYDYLNEMGSGGYHSDQITSANYKLVGFDIYLQNCSYDYYMFQKTYSLYNGISAFQEPIRLHTNMKGGLGYFGGYTAKRVRVLIQ